MRCLPLALALALLAGQSAYGGQYEALAKAIIAMHKAAPKVAPKPAPAPAPSGDVCPDCKGKGQLGDGRTMNTCPTCNGTGKVKHGETAAPEWPSYPLRNSWWSGCPSWRHLSTGEHAGKFDPEWLAQLSNAEVQSLHSDDHEGRVKWDYAVRGPGKAAAKPRPTSNCPGGYCPANSSGSYGGGGLFQRLLNR